MAMTLRLTDEQDAALTRLANAQGISKNEAATRAIEEKAARISREVEVRRLTREAIEQYGPLLDRLAQ
ncbi:CopG family transcriptional regulator [Aeromicrobium sp.]|uniref:CopG family transcriptional regulator n=1 Tax=Aeromicrobium sp. TaxID=1871063 RepID=UPI0035188CDD